VREGGSVVAAMGHRFPDLSVEREILRPVGATLLDLKGLDAPEAVARAALADVVLLGTQVRLDGAAIAGLTRCRAIVRYGIGTDNVDVAAARRRGIQVANVPDYCVEEVSTHALALILALNRRLAEADALARQRRWSDGVALLGTRRLTGTALGVVGFGRIGSRVCAKAAALGMRVLVADPYVGAGQVEAAGGRLVALDELWGQVDALTLHAPLTPGTYHMVNRDTLSRVRAGLILVNVGRGGLVDEVALAEALVQGRVRAAGLDVLESEPPAADHPLLGAPGVLLSPHSAWLSDEAVLDLRTKAALQAVAVLNGGTVSHPVSAEEERP
jgi:D-3-phosphoglycerate dehydrogenase